MKSSLVVMIVAALLFAGCIQQIAVSTVGNIIDDGFDAIAEEQDLQLAGEALPANLKLIEVMLKNEPENKTLLKLASEGYCSYALGFVEDSDSGRARQFYRRGHDYALQMIAQDRSLAKALEGPIDALQEELAKRGKDEVPALFWLAFGLGGYINLSLTNPDAVAEIPRAEAIMKFVAAKDSTFYYGGADLFLGALYGGRPRIFGGDTELSKRHFERALRLNEGKFLMTYVYYARSYAVQTLDEQLFEDLLTRVEQTSLDVAPKIRLANAIAKKKARLLLANKAEMF